MDLKHKEVDIETRDLKIQISWIHEVTNSRVLMKKRNEITILLQLLGVKNFDDWAESFEIETSEHERFHWEKSGVNFNFLHGKRQ